MILQQDRYSTVDQIDYNYIKQKRMLLYNAFQRILDKW